MPKHRKPPAAVEESTPTADAVWVPPAADNTDLEHAWEFPGTRRPPAAPTKETR